MSTTVYGPSVTVSAPLPQPIPFNLFTVAFEVTATDQMGELDARWLNGEYVRPYLQDLGNGIAPCLTGTNALKDAGGETTIPLFGAVTIYVPETCTAYSIIGWDDFQRRANAVLAAVLPWHAEKQLVAGTYKTDNPYLGDINATNPTGGAVSNVAVGPMEALALLEDAIGATGRAGVIHATPGIVAAWMFEGALEHVQGQLRTISGTPVVKGGGYIGEKPLNGAAPSADQSWAWATGPVVYQRSPNAIPNPPTIKEATDRLTNELTYLAESDLLVAWDTQLQVAVLVDRSL